MDNEWTNCIICGIESTDNICDDCDTYCDEVEAEIEADQD